LDNQQVQEEEQQQKQEQGQGQHSHRPGLKQGPGWRSPSAAELASARWVLVDWGSAARLTPAAPSPAALASVEHAKERQTPAAVGADGLPTSSWWRGAALSAMQQPHHHMSPKAADAGVVLGRPGYDTPAYAAPEVLLQGVLTPAADMWSLGATLFEAATGVPLLQLPTRGPALGALLTWLQQQQQQGDSSLGLSVGHSRQEVAAAHPAAGASNSSSSSSSVNVEELVDGSQLALMEALAAGSSSSSSSPALFEWPQVRPLACMWRPDRTTPAVAAW
jgi:serine/threonine protein kinase